MKASARISKDKKLTISVDLSSENKSLVNASTNNAWVSKVELYNTNSYLDDVVIFSRTYNGTTNVFPEEGLVLDENQLNTFQEALNGSGKYDTDMHNDIIVAELTFGYNPNYEIVSECADNPYSRTVATYYPCPLYNSAISAAMQSKGGCCDESCTDSIPYGFMYALLKKKLIDVCIESGCIDKACRYFLKFFKTDNCMCQNSDCDCSQQKQDGKDDNIRTRNCNCHG